MTIKQAAVVEEWLAFMQRNEADVCTIHHGDCVGADADAHAIARALGFRVVIHPPVDPEHRAFCEAPASSSCASDGVAWVEPNTHFKRNRDIVNACSLLLATPHVQPLPDRGGTVYTIGYARKVGKRVVIVWPDGTLG